MVGRAAWGWRKSKNNFQSEQGGEQGILKTVGQSFGRFFKIPSDPCFSSNFDLKFKFLSSSTKGVGVKSQNDEEKWSRSGPG